MKRAYRGVFDPLTRTITFPSGDTYYVTPSGQYINSKKYEDKMLGNIQKKLGKFGRRAHNRKNVTPNKKQD